MRPPVLVPAARVWSALIQPGQWWSSVHTFSHDAHNLTLDPRAGGCWCEALPSGGGVRHMAVVYVAPGQTLRVGVSIGASSFPDAGQTVAALRLDDDGPSDAAAAQIAIPA